MQTTIVMFVIFISVMLMDIAPPVWAGDLAGDLPLARQGHAQVVLVLGADADPAERTAAEELKQYLEQITGATYVLVDQDPGEERICIHVGQTEQVRQLLPDIDWASLGYDGLVLKRSGRHHVIAGGRPRGTLYAVYEFLEKIGCRWYAEDMAPVIPTDPDLSVAWEDQVYVPPFEFRQIYTQATSDPLMAVRFRQNGRQWQAAIPRAWGGTAYFGEGHTLTRHFLRADTYFQKHPEWFAYRKDSQTREKLQPCLTHPDARRVMIENARTYLAKQYATWEYSPKNLGLGYEDNDKICQCDRCEEINTEGGSPGTTLFLFANALGDAIRSDYPDVTVYVLAYWITDRPSSNLSFRENVGAILGVLDRNHKLSIDRVDHFARYLRTYAAAGAPPYVWDYDPHFGNFLIPHPNHFVFPKSARFYQRVGVKGIFLQGAWGTTGELMHLRNYVNSRVMWNPSVDARAEAQAFCEAYYGQAAPMILKYVDLIGRAIHRHPQTWLGVYPGRTDHFLTLADLNRATRLFDEALAVTEQQPEQNARVRRARVSIEVTWIERYHALREEARVTRQPFLGPEDPHVLLEALEANPFKSTIYREWDSYDNYMKKLRQLHGDSPATSSQASEEDTPTPATPGDRVVLGADRLTLYPEGNGQVVEEQAAWREQAVWMPSGDHTREMRYTLPDAWAGRWDVQIRIRAHGQDEAAVAAGIYAPHEIARQIVLCKELSDYRWVDLGEHHLPGRALIWVQPDGAGTWGGAGDVWIDQVRLTRR